MTAPVEDAPLGYTLGRLLGEGGMGRVFEATRSWDGTKVAFKVLHDDARSASARRTLVNEALTTSRLSHPNLVSVVDMGEHPELGVFLVQELVRGTSLEDTLALDAPVDDGVAALASVLEGLTAAHAGGVVHGDLKPSNILLTASGLVKLCDFGVAQSLGPRKDAPGRRIRAGTPQYMAPEQFETAVDLDPRVDLYAVGAMLYQVLTGLLPHRQTESIDGILEEKRHGVPKPRFDRAGRRIPEALGLLVASLTHPDLRRRPRFAAEVLATLQPAARALRETPATGPNRRGEVKGVSPGPIRSAGTELLPTRSLGGGVHSPPPAPSLRGATPAPTESTEPVPFVPASHLPGTAFIHVRPPPLIGRTREIAHLREAMRDAIATHRVRAVLLEGEEGVGKSRLAEWALSECERTGQMEGVAARFSLEGGGAARGLRGLVARLFAPAALDAPEGARETARWLEERGAGEGLDGEALARWLGMSNEDDPLDPHTAAGLAAAALRAYARVRPLYVWLDDALWAHDGAFELAQRLMAGGEGAIVLVLTCNVAALQEERGASRHAALLAHEGLLRFPLARLDEAGRAALLRLAAPLSRALAEEVARTVDATPLVLVQLVSDWLDRGLLSSSPNGLVATGGIASLFDARTPTDVFRHRALGLLSTLQEAAPVLHAAAILGPWCSARALHLVGGELGLDRESIDLILEEGVVRGVLRSEGGGAYRLEHQVFRVELVRAAASSPGYVPLCRAIARSLLEVHGSERPDVRAYAALWSKEAGHPDQATPMLLDAADQMARGGDLGVAHRHLALALRWLDEGGVALDDPRRDLAVYVSARLAYFGLDYATARPLARRAVERWALRGDMESLLRAQNLELRVLFYEGHIEECEALLRSVRLQHRAHITPQSYSHLHHVHLEADLHALRGDLVGARDVLRRGLAHHRASGVYYSFILIIDLACAEAAIGDFTAAAEALAAVHEQGSRLDVYYLAILREAEAAIALARGERRARATFVDLVADREARDDRWRLTSARVALAVHDLRFDEPTARESVTAALAAFARVPHDEALTRALLTWMADTLHDRGETELAEQLDGLLHARLQVGRGETVPPRSLPAGSAPIGPTKPSA